MPKKAVCLISGGIDSCTTAFIAKEEQYDIYALSFRYGQRHQKEIEKAKKIADDINVKDHTIFDLNLSKFGGSSLLQNSSHTPEKHKLDEIGNSIPSTYVSARNTIFLSIALSYAETIKAESIFIGVTATDYAGYPDCRPEYIEAYQKMANLATKRAVEGNPVEIKTPLIKMSKAEIIKKGKNIGANFENTWSCYKGDKKACGKCDSCLLRLKGFKEAGFKDPIPYKSLPDWY